MMPKINLLSLRSFYNQIVHGDADHQLWLRKEFERFWGINLDSIDHPVDEAPSDEDRHP